MTTAFAGLLAHGDGRYALDIDPGSCVGPPGHAYLFGGLTLALALDAAADATGRPVVQGALQFVHFTPLGERLELAVAVLHAGRTLAQVSVTGAVRGRLVLQAAVALGERPGFVGAQWTAGPQPPPPQDCPLLEDLPPQDSNARFLSSIEIRETHLGDPAHGRTALWLRRRDGAPIDAGSLAIFADFVPLALGRSTGRAGGGNSVDNALRVVRAAPAGWCLCDMTIAAAGGGFAHGRAELWDASGQLLAIGAQTLVMKG